MKYGLVQTLESEATSNLYDLEVEKSKLYSNLKDIHEFAVKNDFEGFANCFSLAIKCLESDHEVDEVYHKDLVPTGFLNKDAVSVLYACQLAWVFGGMGSWNDLYFESSQKE